MILVVSMIICFFSASFYSIIIESTYIHLIRAKEAKMEEAWKPMGFGDDNEDNDDVFDDGEY